MPRFSFFLFILLLVTACGQVEQQSTVATATTNSPTTADSTPKVNLAPPPPVCVYLTEATVLSFFDAEVQLPMPGRRSAAEFASCQYDLEAPGWSAALVVELPDPGAKQQAIIDEVAGAKGADKVTLGSATGRFQNDGRILSVAGNKHFRIKFSALPKAGFDAPFSEEERKDLLVRMASGVLAI